MAAIATLLPHRAKAFWPFSTSADAAVNELLPSSSTPALDAPLNSDPNSAAPVTLATSGEVALLSYGGPDGTEAADAYVPPSSDRISVYVVRPGDTLSEIAGMYGVSINTIMWANNLSSARDVHPGDTLVILPVSGIEHTVGKNDTLASLAKKYSANASEIAQYNGLDPAQKLAVGSKIIIPGGELAPPSVNHRVRRIIREPYLGGSGLAQVGYYGNPVPGAILTQGIHGWNGVDLGARRGTPILAAAAGTVIISRSNGGWNGGYGNYVVITHENGTETLYSHMTRAIVSPGAFVQKGQVIGYIGATGMATGPHLHFEVRGAQNPFAFCVVGTVCSPR